MVTKPLPEFCAGINKFAEGGFTTIPAAGIWRKQHPFLPQPYSSFLLKKREVCKTISPKINVIMSTQNITVQQVVNAPLEKVWNYFTTPQHIMQWNNASPDWHTPRAENDLRTGGRFNSRMEARDGSMGFDFWGTYDAVTPHELIAYTLGDGRKVTVQFAPEGNSTSVVEQFEAESQNPVDMQRTGWQAILDNFKAYTESH
jgi:uncharacterized protein YndB with AHSA1/START domain